MDAVPKKNGLIPHLLQKRRYPPLYVQTLLLYPLPTSMMDYISHFPNFQLSPCGLPPTLLVPLVAYFFPCEVHATLF